MTYDEVMLGLLVILGFVGLGLIGYGSLGRPPSVIERDLQNLEKERK